MPFKNISHERSQHRLCMDMSRRLSSRIEAGKPAFGCETVIKQSQRLLDDSVTLTREHRADLVKRVSELQGLVLKRKERP